MDENLKITIDNVNKYLQHSQIDGDTSIVERARQVAVQAHLHQTRWNGAAYITHPIRVALSVNSDDEKVVSYNHDVDEDTELTLEDLRSFGFSETQLAAIESVTIREGENYLDFILRAKENKIGRVVKIADIKDNLSDLDRSKHKHMYDKYLLALWILERDEKWDEVLREEVLGYLRKDAAGVSRDMDRRMVHAKHLLSQTELVKELKTGAEILKAESLEG